MPYWCVYRRGDVEGRDAVVELPPSFPSAESERGDFVLGLSPAPLLRKTSVRQNDLRALAMMLSVDSFSSQGARDFVQLYEPP